MKKEVTKSFSIFSETGKELIEIARKYCNFQFDKYFTVPIGGVHYKFFASTLTDEIKVSKMVHHEKVKA